MKDLRIKTWSCPCGYKQDFEPSDENNAIHFRGLPRGACPSCKVGELLAVEKEADCSFVSTVEVGDVIGEDKDGNPITVEEKDLKAPEGEPFSEADAKAWNEEPWEAIDSK